MKQTIAIILFISLIIYLLYVFVFKGINTEPIIKEDKIINTDTVDNKEELLIASENLEDDCYTENQLEGKHIKEISDIFIEVDKLLIEGGDYNKEKLQYLIQHRLKEAATEYSNDLTGDLSKEIEYIKAYESTEFTEEEIINLTNSESEEVPDYVIDTIFNDEEYNPIEKPESKPLDVSNQINFK